MVNVSYELSVFFSEIFKNKIERVMHKIDQDVEILNHKNIIPVPVGIAYGYAVFTADDTDPEKVRERADEDMYRNKKTMKQS